MALLSDLSVRLRSSWRILIKELSGFGVVGGVCLVIDLGLFQLLYAQAGLGPVAAKLVSTAVSVTAAYFGHRHWSFSHRARTSLRREYSLFFVVNGLALLLGLGVVAFVHYVLRQDSALVLQLANIVSIGAGTVLRYLCYRAWVFVSDDNPAAVAHRLHQERRVRQFDCERAAA
jgi:putative flippase GtrA